MSKEELEKTLLEKLSQQEQITSNDLSEYKLTDLHALLLSLASKEIVSYEMEQENKLVVTEKGQELLKNGSPEYNCMMKLLNTEIKRVEEIEDKEIVNNIYKNKWMKMKKEDIVDEVKIVMEKNLINSIEIDFKIDANNLKLLKKRKLVELKKVNKYFIKKGTAFGSNNINYVTELTVDNLFTTDASQLKPYNFNVEKTISTNGSLHPLMKIKKEFKGIFLEMGFTEMATNKYVENSFWNFDALFQPQNHPSRECQDTFFLSYPKEDSLTDIDKDYIKRVSDVHSSTYDNDKNEFKCYSQGHKNIWKIEEAKKNILRTHTTAVSAKLLHDLAEKIRKTGKYDYKYFSIDKVFRNETVDATHLAEFHQIEGVIVGKNLALKELIAVIQTFFKKLGITNLRFKPAFNPYTEPSMEIFGYHKGLGKWMELGNSGIFRPEMLLPMGFPEDVTVIAWGLSLERPAMIRYGLNNIRELVGHKVDINFIRDSPVVFMDK